MALVLMHNTASAGTDSLQVSNGDILVGDIVKMTRGVLYIDTEYASADFEIKWHKVQHVYSAGTYIISLKSGHRLTGTLSSNPDNKASIRIVSHEGSRIVQQDDIVFFKALNQHAMERLSASLDFGNTFTKSNNLRQLSLGSDLGYLSDNWNAEGKLHLIRNHQDKIAPVRRTEAQGTFSYFLDKSWFAQFSANFLHNDELKLKMRYRPMFGVGNYLIQTNAWYWSLFVGGAMNHETHTDPSIPNRSSGELNIASDINLFDMGNIDVITSLSIYKSMKKDKRLRADYRFDIRYNLPRDFYVKLGLVSNYDNVPAEGASQYDYVLRTSLGWKL